MRWSAFLFQYGYVASRNEARRLIAAGALSVDGKRVEQDQVAADLTGHPYVAVGIRLGKHRFGSVLFNAGDMALISKEPLMGAEVKKVGEGWYVSKGPAPTHVLGAFD